MEMRKPIGISPGLYYSRKTFQIMAEGTRTVNPNSMAMWINGRYRPPDSVVAQSLVTVLFSVATDLRAQECLRHGLASQS